MAYLNTLDRTTQLRSLIELPLSRWTMRPFLPCAYKLQWSLVFKNESFEKGSFPPSCRSAVFKGRRWLRNLSTVAELCWWKWHPSNSFADCTTWKPSRHESAGNLPFHLMQGNFLTVWWRKKAAVRGYYIGIPVHGRNFTETSAILKRHLSISYGAPWSSLAFSWGPSLKCLQSIHPQATIT